MLEGLSIWAVTIGPRAPRTDNLYPVNWQRQAECGPMANYPMDMTKEQLMGAIAPGSEGLGWSASPIRETTDRGNLLAISPLNPLILPRSMTLTVKQSDRMLRLLTRQNQYSGTCRQWPRSTSRSWRRSADLEK